jgi:hypothetical protein
MQRVIRDRGTDRFLCLDGSWSAEWKAARRFEDSTKLIDVALHLPQPELEEVIMFGEVPSEYDITLPLFVFERG